MNNTQLSMESTAQAVDSFRRQMIATMPDLRINQSSSGVDPAKSTKLSFSVKNSIVMEMRVRGDNKAVILSSVVHRLPHKEILMASGPELRRLISPYSLMTKMMKINTRLNRESPSTQVGMYEGSFVIFKTVPVDLLEEQSSLKFHQTVTDFIMRASDSSKEFRTSSRNHRLQRIRRPKSPSAHAA